MRKRKRKREIPAHAGMKNTRWKKRRSIGMREHRRIFIPATVLCTCLAARINPVACGYKFLLPKEVPPHIRHNEWKQKRRKKNSMTQYSPTKLQEEIIIIDSAPDAPITRSSRNRSQRVRVSSQRGCLCPLNRRRFLTRVPKHQLKSKIDTQHSTFSVERLKKNSQIRKKIDSNFSFDCFSAL